MICVARSLSWRRVMSTKMMKPMPELRPAIRMVTVLRVRKLGTKMARWQVLKVPSGLRLPS